MQGAPGSDRPTRTGPSAPGSGGYVAIRRHDADRPVGFEGRELHLLHRVESVLAEGGLDVDEVQALPDQLRQEPGAVASNHGRPEFEEPADERQAHAQGSNESIEDEQREDHDQPAGDRRIGPGDRRLQGVRGKQNQGEVEERELADLAFAEQPEGAEEGHVDERSPDYELERWRSKSPHSAGPQGSMASETMMRLSLSLIHISEPTRLGMI